MLEFVPPTHPVLKEKAAEIRYEEIGGEEIQSIIDQMIDLACGEQKDINRPILVGLAAPQIGISKRIILVDVGANGKGVVSQLNAYINPKILWRSEEKEEWYEACYSTGRCVGIVSRPSKVRISAYDRRGNEVTEEHTGYVARIFQHESDHLNGVRFTQWVEDDAKLHWVEPHEFPLYRNQERWRSWTRRFPREQLEY